LINEIFLISLNAILNEVVSSLNSSLYHKNPFPSKLLE
jgi:hypothetical protein